MRPGVSKALLTVRLQQSATDGRFPDEPVSPDLQAEALAGLALEVGPDQALLNRCTTLAGEEISLRAISPRT